tara:strand:- start:73 stop:453 length:381 start_codon:yes stop_codon:yes gene_type:complete
MKTPKDLYYTKSHEWLKINNDEIIIGITDYAQNELGDIVFVEIDKFDENIDSGEIFGTIEAVKTVADLYLPIAGKIFEKNENLNEKPELINQSPYDNGWIIKVKPNESIDLKLFLNESSYNELISF